MNKLILTIILLIMSFANLVHARRVEIWEYDRLFKEADVIVIASAKETTDSDEQFPAEQGKGSFIAQHTVFEVINTLKGKVDDGPLTVLHFRQQEGQLVVNGPILIKFKLKRIKIKEVDLVAVTEAPQYLLFLTKSDKQVFEPVSGQYDSRFSFKEIYAPLPDRLEEK